MYSGRESQTYLLFLGRLHGNHINISQSAFLSAESAAEAKLFLSERKMCVNMLFVCSSVFTL